VAWAEWIRHQEIQDPADLAGVAAALWAVLLPEAWSDLGLTEVKLPMAEVLGATPEAQAARLALVDQFRAQGAQGLLAPTAALNHSDVACPCVRVHDGEEQADVLPGWCCVPAGRPEPELLPLVRREGMLIP
jgi:hypothetical protein